MIYRIKKAFIYLHHYGLKDFLIRVRERIRPYDIDYGTWYLRHKTSEEILELQRQELFEVQPLISVVVPVYNTPAEYLEQMIHSVMWQTYSNWELCLANANPNNQEVTHILSVFRKKDKRIKIVDIPENEGIAQNTNAAIAIATGEYIGFLDHDDILAPDALYEVVKKLNENRDYELIYSDEDKISGDGSKHFQPHFKPEFNLDLLRANNYICHFSVIKKNLIDASGGLKGEFNGAQDYELIFQCVEKAKKIARIPKILYHWRVHENSTSDNPTSKMYAYDAGKRAIEEHLKRCGEDAEVSCKKDLGFYRVKYKVQGNPLVSIIIPNKDHVEDLEKCLESLEKSTYKNYEVIIVENNSEDRKTIEYYERIQSDKIKIIHWEQGFNYSAINNYGVCHAAGEYLLFLNNDTEAMDENLLTELLSNCQRRQVGIVGAKLYYHDNTLQHAGIVVGIGGVAGNMFSKLPGEFSGYMHKADIQQNLSAVTAACMMVKKTVFEEVDGFTEELAVAFNDVDFCLKACEKGWLIVYDPYAKLYHYESKSRGAEDTKEKIERFQREITYMKNQWGGILKNGDPMYNPNLTLKKQDYSLK